MNSKHALRVCRSYLQRETRQIRIELAALVHVQTSYEWSVSWSPVPLQLFALRYVIIAPFGLCSISKMEALTCIIMGLWKNIICICMCVCVCVLIRQDTTSYAKYWQWSIWNIYKSQYWHLASTTGFTVTGWLDWCENLWLDKSNVRQWNCSSDN